MLKTFFKRGTSMFLAVLMVITMFGMIDFNTYAAETGNTPATAYVLTEGISRTHTWTSGNSDDFCYSKVVMEQDGLLTFTATRPTESDGDFADYEVYFIDELGNEIGIYATHNGNDVTGIAEYYIGLKAGVYFLKFDALFRVKSGSVSTTYSYNATYGDYFEKESNDTTFEATAIELGKVYTGYINNRYMLGDDYYSVYMNAGTTYELISDDFARLTQSGTLMLDYIIPNGNEYTLNYDIAYNSSYDAYVSKFNAPVSGRYYLKLWNTSGKQAKYSFQIRQYDPCTSGHKYSNGYCTVCNAEQKLSAPKITLSGLLSSGAIKISWSKVSRAYKYEVYRSTSKTTGFTKIGTTTGTSYTNTDSTPGKTYYYKVKAIHKTNSSLNSNYSAVSYRTRDLPRPEITLSYVTSTGKVKVSWNKIEGAAKYEVWRATSENGTYYRQYTTSKNYYTDTKGTIGKTYYYKVKALHEKEAANSAYSLVVSKRSKLATPKITKTTLSSGKPKVYWGKVEKANRYYVYRSTTKNGTYSKIGSTTKTYYTDKTAKKGKGYYYKVVAVYDKSSKVNSYQSSYVYKKATK